MEQENKYTQKDLTVTYITGYLKSVIQHQVELPISVDISKDIMNDVLKLLVEYDLVGEIDYQYNDTATIKIHEKPLDDSVLNIFDGLPYVG